jgi:hypothetical protein
MKKIKKKKY